EYLKAVKKMRISRKRNSGMSYLFSAKDLAQAERRMRYLKEFSDWKDRQTKDIQAKVAELTKANAELKKAKSDKDVMLGRELKVQNKLSEQKQRQNVVIAELKANGTALKTHLAKKQSEVNALRNQVAAVIAEEQRKAESERRIRDEAARAEQERIERQKAAEEQARIERETKEQAVREAAEKSERDATSNDKKTRDKTSAKDQTKKTANIKDKNKKDKDTGKTKDDGKNGNAGGKENKGGTQDYAKARNRKPRGESGKNKSGKEGKVKESGKIEPAKKETPGKETQQQEKPERKSPGASGANFAASRGALPRPVGGAWRVIGKFGRHALPDLPDVIYDNPGIDVEVSKGATVKSVFGGEVSGVYVVPGFLTVIIVSHGDYYTVYGNIGKASVKVGDVIRQGQAIGTLTEDADNPGRSSLHFEVWKGREKLNPQSWIQ
ncbi:MAG: peptidoglycan DD-metalloendopeptidase family protein, partial [Muribaculaceae bacterium]|nr:peptidoglycan DD-metalloendopeptidase family protein [Muribaculaceae bacterium]